MASFTAACITRSFIHLVPSSVTHSLIYSITHSSLPLFTLSLIHLHYSPITISHSLNQPLYCCRPSFYVHHHVLFFFICFSALTRDTTIVHVVSIRRRCYFLMACLLLIFITQNHCMAFLPTLTHTPRCTGSGAGRDTTALASRSCKRCAPVYHAVALYTLVSFL